MGFSRRHKKKVCSYGYACTVADDKTPHMSQEFLELMTVLESMNRIQRLKRQVDAFRAKAVIPFFVNTIVSSLRA